MSGKRKESGEDAKGLVWERALAPGELPDGRVKPVTCHHSTVCMTHKDGQYAALDNRCPHQGGPLGEGSIENGWLRCPWHGWDFDPLTGLPPGGFDDGVQTYPVEVRDDGVYVGFPKEEAHVRTVTDVMVETMVNWGVRAVWGMVGHSNLGLADALRRQEAEGTLRYWGIRHEGAASFAASAYGKLTGRPAACFSIAGPGATNLLTVFGMPTWTGPPSWRSPGRWTRRCWAPAPSRRSIYRLPSARLPSGRSRCCTPRSTLSWSRSPARARS